MSGFENPYLETREKSQGELAQEYASLLSMASLFLGLSFTDTEKRAFAVCIGALMRERKKVDLSKLIGLLKMVMPA